MRHSHIFVLFASVCSWNNTCHAAMCVIAYQFMGGNLVHRVTVSNTNYITKHSTFYSIQGYHLAWIQSKNTLFLIAKIEFHAFIYKNIKTEIREHNRYSTIVSKPAGRPVSSASREYMCSILLGHDCAVFNVYCRSSN